MTEDTKQQSQEHDFGPGALLKRTREQQDLSLGEVSTRLKLTLSVLENIERDDYEGELPVTFYRGYIKNYAELLELDDVDIVANFQQYCQKHKLFSAPPPKLQGLELDKPVSSSNWLFKVVTGLIILALVAAIYYMVVEKELWKKVIPNNGETEVINSESNSLEPNGLTIGEDSSTNGEQINTSPRQESDSAESSNDPELSLGNTASDSGRSEPIDNTGELDFSDTAQAQEQEVVAEPQSSTEQAQPTSFGGQLSIKFTDDCWVRIEDATGKVLALGIKSGGTSLQLSGQAPYNLTLGKASAVQLSYDGDAVDLSQYPDTRAAKLTLGES